MSRVCHECGMHVENPFYSISLAVKDGKGKIALSNLEVSLCQKEIDKVANDLQPTIDRADLSVCYAIDTVTGEVGGSMRSVQFLSDTYDRHGRYKFLSKEIALQALPQSANDLLRKPKWMEMVDDEWASADWANRVYRRAANS